MVSPDDKTIYTDVLSKECSLSNLIKSTVVDEDVRIGITASGDRTASQDSSHVYLKWLSLIRCLLVLVLIF